jgi:transcriptional regulator with XRE-family HTH domain
MSRDHLPSTPQAPTGSRVGPEESDFTFLGDRLRARRTGLGLSLSELAAEVGVSASFLSQVERSPSIDSLARISRALDVPIYYFLVDSPSPVVRHDERQILSMPDSSLRYELLCPDLRKSMEAWLARLAPGQVSSAVPLSHSTEEFVFVLQGELEMRVGPHTYRLGPHDSLYYHGLVPHQFTSVGDEELVFVSAVTPPILGQLDASSL